MIALACSSCLADLLVADEVAQQSRLSRLCRLVSDTCPGPISSRLLHFSLKHTFLMNNRCSDGSLTFLRFQIMNDLPSNQRTDQPTDGHGTGVQRKFILPKKYLFAVLEEGTILPIKLKNVVSVICWIRNARLLFFKSQISN